MLDRELLANHPELVRASLVRRKASKELFDAVERLSAIIARRRALQAEADKCRMVKNELSPKIGALMKAGDREEAEALKLQVKTANEQADLLDKEGSSLYSEENELLMGLPNIVAGDTPDGASDHENPVVRTVGEKPVFDFKPKAHEEVAAELGMYDPNRAAKLSGSRFVVLSHGLARLERALIQFYLDLHVDGHGYTEWVVPYLVTRETLTGTGQLPKFEEDLFKLTDKLANQDAFLIPTAEVPVTNLHRDEILDESVLPLKYCAFTPCFRSEAGSWGKDTKGMIRLHQFHKVELVWFVQPEKSMDVLETLTGHAEVGLQKLGLPYQVVARCSADVGNGGAKGYDIEVWLPAQHAYREISSCTNFTDYQARRLMCRFKRAGEKRPVLVHTLNGSGLAIGRTVAAILENYQQSDGSVVIPEVLRPYMRGLERLVKP
jgi:seryl-tRNA synthetase